MSLCLPAVKESFEWGGKKVASLCKSGGFIYLIADDYLPGWQRLVSKAITITCNNYEFVCNLDQKGSTSNKFKFK